MRLIRGIRPNGYYGFAIYAPGRTHKFTAHEFAFFFLGHKVRNINQDVSHDCKNKWCVNEEHLTARDRGEHLEYDNNPLYMRKFDERCHNNHEHNWFIKPNGTRRCRTCDAEIHAKRRIPGTTSLGLCHRGIHDLNDPDNQSWYKNTRRCRPCELLKNKEKYKRKKLQAQNMPA